MCVTATLYSAVPCVIAYLILKSLFLNVFSFLKYLAYRHIDSLTGLKKCNLNAGANLNCVHTFQHGFTL